MVDALGTEHSSRRLPRRRHRRRASRSVIRHTERPILRTAPAPHAHAVEAGARQRLQGGADRRGRRRGVRRLRHLQGGEGAPLLRARSRRRSAARCCSSGSIPTCRACRASRSSYLEAFFGAPRGRARRSAASRTCRASAPPPAPSCSSRADLRTRDRRLRRARRSARRAAGRLRALASAVAGAVSRRRATCCPATSCPRRATAWRWRMPSRGASRSSTTAWWSSPRASRRA